MANKIISEADQQIGKNVRRCRTLADLDQGSLGRALRHPVSYQQISKIEMGYNRVSAIQLVDIAKACNCRVADLLAGVDPIVAEAGGFVEQITEGEGDLVRSYRRIRNPEIQKLVRTMCHALITETANSLRVS